MITAIVQRFPTTPTTSNTATSMVMTMLTVRVGGIPEQSENRSQCYGWSYICTCRILSRLKWIFTESCLLVDFQTCRRVADCPNKNTEVDGQQQTTVNEQANSNHAARHNRWSECESYRRDARFIPEATERKTGSMANDVIKDDCSPCLLGNNNNNVQQLESSRSGLKFESFF